MRRAILICLAVAGLAACGGTPAAVQPTAPPQAIQPTPTTRPTTAATTKGLGIARDVLQSKFSGFTFADDPSHADRIAVKGTNATPGLAIVLFGAAANVEEAQVQLEPGAHDANAAGLQAMIDLLTVAAPGIKDPTTWLQPHLEKALKNHTDLAIESGRQVTIISSPEAKLLVLSVRAA